MSTPQGIAHQPRLRIGLGTLMAALGVLIAVGATIAFLALTGAHHTTIASPPTGLRAASASTQHVLYLGPRQVSEELAAQSVHGGVTAPGAVGAAAPHYTCLGGEQRCRR
jgi:hypothetical protein